MSLPAAAPPNAAKATLLSATPSNVVRSCTVSVTVSSGVRFSATFAAFPENQPAVPSNSAAYSYASPHFAYTVSAFAGIVRTSLPTRVPTSNVALVYQPSKTRLSFTDKYIESNPDKDEPSAIITSATSLPPFVSNVAA